MKKLAIITTHPIQYNAPFFRMLHSRGNIAVKVFYTWSQSASGGEFDPGFQRAVSWDIDLLEGYDHVFSENTAAEPGSHHFSGIQNPALISEIKAWAPDAVMVYGWSFKSHLKTMKYFHKKIPVLFRGDSTLLDEQPGIKQLIRRIALKNIYKNIDIALYAGEANKAYFKAHGLKEDQLVFMPHAVENERFFESAANTAAGKEIRKTHRIPEDAFVFLFAGKLETKKQPDMLAAAFIKAADKDAHLLIAGTGELEHALKAAYGAHRKIHFAGFTNQAAMPGLYAACNVFVLPSKGPGETWGLALNEAMAAGKPVIAGSACGAAQDLVNDNTGIVFEKNDAAALQQAMAFFIKHKEKAATMGSAALQLIKQYSFEKECMAVEAVLNK